MTLGRTLCVPALTLILAVCAPALAQSRPAKESLMPQIIIPQAPRHIMPSEIRPPDRVRVVDVKAKVRIEAQVAVTELLIGLKNDGVRRVESQLVMPVPGGAVVRGFGFDGAGKELTAEVLPREEARRIYNEIVTKLRDPALLEFADHNLVRSSVFPVEPGKNQVVKLVYENLLSAEGNRIDYYLPRSESLRYDLPWSIEVRVSAARNISTLYSPSHELTVKRIDERTVSAKLAPGGVRKPGPFRLGILLQESDGVTAALYSYPDPKIGGGYFLLLAGLPADGRKRLVIKREVTIVIDRSGSMRGEKIAQVKEAALQVVEGLEEGEAFNCMVYNDRVGQFAERPIIKNAQTMTAIRSYLQDIKVQGGTNIHDALVESLRQKPVADMLPIVLFLTDGLPTFGETSERAIRQVAAKGNLYNRRTFTFGVGVDVNTPLLERVALETRAKARFILPQEDVEVKVAEVFRSLAGPVMADTAFAVLDDKGDRSPRLLRDVIPARLPDLFENDQLVLLGQYVGERPLTFVISGNYLGSNRVFKFSFSLDKATTRNSFVPRLWASRKIAVLETAIRDLGADLGISEREILAGNDPRLKELIGEIVVLSTKFGILTEYTAFLARDETKLGRREMMLEQAIGNYQKRALRVRSGMGSVSQEANIAAHRSQQVLDYHNSYLDVEMNRVSIRTVQQINDLAFYRRGNRWIDSRLIGKKLSAKPSRQIDFGSKEFSELVKRLTREHRNGCLSLHGEVLLEIDGKDVLISAP